MEAIASSVGNIVVLIDVYTRKVVESITYDALIKHVSVITDIRELGESHYGCDLVFFESSVPLTVSPEVLTVLVDTLAIKPHLVYNAVEVKELFGEAVHAVKANYRVLEWNLVYAVVNNDTAILGPYQRIQQEKLAFSDLLDSLPEQFCGDINNLYLSYMSLAHSNYAMLSDVARYKEMIGNYRAIGDRTTRALNELTQLLQQAEDQNKTYAAMLSESYDVTFNGVYADRPRVLYIKTISHLAGIDSLIAILYAVLTKQYKESCKVVKLVDSANASSLRYVPNNYVPLSDNYNTYDVLNEDFIMKLGAYNMLMSLLMLNRSGLSYLIVHDMRGSMQQALDSSLIDLYLNEMSADYAVLGEYDNILSSIDSSQSREMRFVWKFEDVINYTGSRIAKLSNHPTVTMILDYLM